MYFFNKPLADRVYSELTEVIYVVNEDYLYLSVRSKST